MATVAPESAMAGLDPMFHPDWFLTDEQLRAARAAEGDLRGDDPAARGRERSARSPSRARASRRSRRTGSSA